jgi:hypothetical protein
MAAMSPAAILFGAPWLTLLAVAGIGVGLWLLGRGLRDHVTGTRIEDTSTSAIGAIALGEVRVSGVVEPAELVLVSPLQSRRCVYYRAAIREERSDPYEPAFRDERSVGFRVNDGSGSLRVFPRGARWDVPVGFAEGTGMLGDEPPGLSFRMGPVFEPAHQTDAELVAQLLTVRPAATGLGTPAWARSSSRRRKYEEARIEPGETVTIIGRVLRFEDLPDPAEADVDDAAGGPLAALADPAVAASYAEARAAGILVDSPDEAWGNAAIPGFGIGRPTRPPELDPDADPLPLAGPEEQARFERTFDLAPDALVLASSAEVPLVIASGAPAGVVGRHRNRLAVGLLGGVLAIGSAVVLAASLSGMIGG